MAEPPRTAMGLTRRAIDAAQAGEVGDARRLLAEALALNPTYEPAWMWFASVAANDSERRFCLEKALEANPESAARAALARLRQVAPTMPPEVEPIIDPPAPADVLAAPVVTKRRRGLVAAIVLATAAILAAATFFVVRGGGKSPVYLAFVAGITGPDPALTKEMEQGTELYLKELNGAGGVNGHPVKLLVYDDKDDANLARQRAQQIVADHRVLGVIGNRTSPAALAAGPIYKAGGLLAITPTATADGVTTGNPWYFSTVFTNSTQGHFIATYLREIFHERTVTMVQGSEDYGQTLSAGVRAGLGTGVTLASTVTINTAQTPTDAAVDAAVSAIVASHPTGTIVLALPSSAAVKVVPALRRAGIENRIFGADAIGSDAFFATLAALPEERSHPGSLIHDVYATAPLIADSLTGDGVRWLSAYTAAYAPGGAPARPTWRAATSYEAAAALVHGIEVGGLDFATDAVKADRQRVRDALATVNGPAASLHGLAGPVWFGSTGAAAEPVLVGLGAGNRFISAPDQLRRYDPVDTQATQAAIAAGQVIRSGDRYYQRQRVVTIGVNVNQISALNQQDQTFNVDFFVWLKYTGADDAKDLEFPNATDHNLSLGDPVRSSRQNGSSYVLYHVNAVFKAGLNFRDFPFDTQDLTIAVKNRNLSASEVVYAGDIEVLSAPQSERLTSGSNASESIDAINDWKATSLYFFQTTVGSTAALGDTSLRGGATGTSYSEFVTDITIGRDVKSFLVKNLLPLILLAAVTYTSLFFSPSQTGARVSFGITGILTGAVLLSELTSSLPSVGYTVALAWGYYAFILLSAGCVLVGLLSDRLWENRQLAAVRRLVLVSRIAYPLVILGVVLAYFFLYG